MGGYARFCANTVRSYIRDYCIPDADCIRFKQPTVLNVEGVNEKLMLLSL